LSELVDGIVKALDCGQADEALAAHHLSRSWCRNALRTFWNLTVKCRER
jgi:hypothetical protein